MRRHGRAARVPDALYRALLVAYPRRFRQRFGAPLRQAFGDRCRDARRRGWLPLAALLARSLVDVAVNAAALRAGAMIERVFWPDRPTAAPAKEEPP